MNSEIVLLTYVYTLLPACRACGLAEVEISAWLLGKVIKYKLGNVCRTWTQVLIDTRFLVRVTWTGFLWDTAWTGFLCG